MSIFKAFWKDESGTILSAEMVLIGTLGIVGATVGVHQLTTALNEELSEVAYAFRSLDQSYSFSGFSGCRAWTAGSEYVQADVETSLAGLKAQKEQKLSEERSRQQKSRREKNLRRMEELRKRQELRRRNELRRRGKDRRDRRQPDLQDKRRSPEKPSPRKKPEKKEPRRVDI